jgi:hypothetical protein
MLMNKMADLKTGINLNSADTCLAGQIISIEDRVLELQFAALTSISCASK